MADVQLDRAILPVFRCSIDAMGAHRPLEFMGTSFVAVPGVLVTCRHCVPDLELPDGEFYAAMDASDAKEGQPSRSGASYRLVDLEHDSRGHDLALARVPSTISPVGRLSSALITGIGFDVGTLAYPGTAGVHDPNLDLRVFGLVGRWLQGYVTRSFLYSPPDGGPPRRSWEIDMTAPGGTSGAPLIVLSPHERAGTIVGVIYGRYPAFADVAEGALIQEPPVWFSLAHTDDVLLGLAGTATGGRRLLDLAAAARE